MKNAAVRCIYKLMANYGTSFLTKVIHSWLFEVLCIKLLSWDQSPNTMNKAIYQC